MRQVIETGIEEYELEKEQSFSLLKINDPEVMGRKIEEVDPHFFKWGKKAFEKDGVYQLSFYEDSFNSGIIDDAVVELFENNFLPEMSVRKRANAIGLGNLWHWYLDNKPSKTMMVALASIVNVPNRTLEIPFDSEGYYGISKADCTQAWYLSGCGRNTQYFINIILALSEFINKKGNISNISLAGMKMLPRRYMSKREIKRALDFIDELEFNNITVSSSLIWRVSKLSYPTRLMVINQLKDLNKTRDIARYNDYDRLDIAVNSRSRYWNIYSTKHIDWNKLNRPQYRLVKECSDRAYQWFWLADKFNVTLNKEASIWRQLPSPMSLNKKQLIVIVDYSRKLNRDIHSLITVVNIVLLYGNDLQAINRVTGQVQIGSVLTRVDMIERLGDAKKDFAKLLSSDTRFANDALSGMFSSIVKILGRMPKSFEEASAIAATLEYENITEPGLLPYLNGVSLDQETFEIVQSHYRKFKNKVDNVTKLPFNVTSAIDGYTCKLLSKGDHRGWVLGEFTNCCQSINNAGGSCAKAGMLDADKGFLVITDSKGTIVTQSWVWTRNGYLVLDSIESKGLADKQMDRVANVVKAWGRQACSTIFVDGLKLGKTNYGITKDMRKLLVSKKKTSTLAPSNYKGYIDGDVQYDIDLSE